MVKWRMINFVYVCCLVLKRTNITDSVALIILMESDGATVKWQRTQREMSTHSWLFS